jgi:hypothetical protein
VFLDDDEQMFKVWAGARAIPLGPADPLDKADLSALVWRLTKERRAADERQRQGQRENRP